MADESGMDDFGELSNEELQEMAEKFVDQFPRIMSEILGTEFPSELEEDEKRQFENKIEGYLRDFRNAMTVESEEEQTIALFEVYDKATEDVIGPIDGEEFDGGLDSLIEQQKRVLEGTQKAMEELGHVEYFDLINEFAAEVVEKGQSSDIKKFFKDIENNSEQILLQRVTNSVLTDHFDYLETHQEITEADEAREYAKIYYELAELIATILPRFIAVLQIVSGRHETYDELKHMGLNDLLQKLESDKYARFSALASGVNRKLRNSIAHRDFKVNPVAKEIEFQDRNEPVAKFTYSEFQNEVFHILAVFNALWGFRLMVNYYRLRKLPKAVEELQKRVS